MTHASGNPNHVQVSITADISHLSDGNRRALPYLREAVEITEAVWSKQRKHEDFTAERLAIARELKAAAEFVTDAGFRSFLVGRAGAFRTNSYHQSDIEWVRCLGAPLEIIIGPFDPVDELEGEKEFEGTLGIVLPNQQALVAQYALLASEFEAEIARQYGFLPNYAVDPITFVDVLATGGGARHYTAMASKMPNDGDIRAIVGSKTTLFWNVISAKLRHLTIPIARRVLSVELDLETFVKLIVGHELSHGFNNFNFNIQGEAFGRFASPLEEGKAEVHGVLFLYRMARRGAESRQVAEDAAIACIADSLREIRVGPSEAHAIGARIRYNWLLTTGAMTLRENKLNVQRDMLFVAFSELGEAFHKLFQTHSFEEAQAFIEAFGGVPDSLKSIVESLEDLPVDIDPIFQV